MGPNPFVVVMSGRGGMAQSSMGGAAHRRFENTAQERRSMGANPFVLVMRGRCGMAHLQWAELLSAASKIRHGKGGRRGPILSSW